MTAPTLAADAAAHPATPPPSLADWLAQAQQRHADAAQAVAEGLLERTASQPAGR